MPPVNDVGEPCAGKSHARFEVAGAGNGAARRGICGPRAGVLKQATTMAWSGTTPPDHCHRASARPYIGLSERVALLPLRVGRRRCGRGRLR